MRSKTAWALLALIVGACAIPDVRIVDSLDDTGTHDGGAPSDSGGTKSSAGKTGNSAGDGTGGTNDGEGGDTSSGAQPSGGKASGGSGGSSGGRGGSGGAGNGGGGRGGSGPLPSGDAIAKFCNEVTLGGEEVDIELHIGPVSDPTIIVARTGTCEPIVYADCTSIPTGLKMPIQVYDLDGNLYWEGSADFTEGEAWLFVFYYDTEAATPDLVARADLTAQECAETDFETLYPPEETAP